MVLEWMQKVDVLEYYSDVSVASASDSFPLPAVMRCRVYVQKPRRRGARMLVSKRNILLRDRHTCQCAPLPFVAAAQPVSCVRGPAPGTTVAVWLCGRCLQIALIAPIALQIVAWLRNACIASQRLCVAVCMNGGLFVRALLDGS